MTAALSSRGRADRGAARVAHFEPEDEPGVRELLRAPMDGAVSLSLECEPDCRLAAGIQGDRHATVVARERGRIVACGSRAVRLAHHRGRPARLGYLSQLRRDARAVPAVRRLLRESFAALESTREPEELPFDATTIVADNEPARRLLERGLPGLPRYHPVAELLTYVIPSGGRRAPPLPGAARSQLPAVAACLQRTLAAHPLSPVWTAADLEGDRCLDLEPDDIAIVRDAGSVRACGALWDQRRFKQSVIRGYAPPLSHLRPLINAGFAVARRPRLPPPGAVLASAYLSHVAVDGGDVPTFLDLVARARRRAAERGIDWVVTAFARHHPFGRALEKRFRPRTYASVIYLVSRDDAFPGARELGPGLPHLEVATL